MKDTKHGERPERSPIVIALEDILGLTRLDRYTDGDFRLEKCYFESPTEPGTYFFPHLIETCNGEDRYEVVRFDPDDFDQALDLVEVLFCAFDSAADRWIPKDRSHPNVSAREWFDRAVSFVQENGPVQWTNRS